MTFFGHGRDITLLCGLLLNLNFMNGFSLWCQFGVIAQAIKVRLAENRLNQAHNESFIKSIKCREKKMRTMKKT